MLTNTAPGCKEHTYLYAQVIVSHVRPHVDYLPFEKG